MSDEDTHKPAGESARILGRDRFSSHRADRTPGHPSYDDCKADRYDHARKRVLKRLLNRRKGRPDLRIVDSDSTG